MKQFAAVLCLLAALSGCTPGESAPFVPAVPPAAHAGLAGALPAPQDGDGGEGRRAFKQAMLPLFAGNYGGACALFPSGARARAIRVGADGRVNAPALELDVMRPDTDLLFARKFIDGRASEAYVLAVQADSGLSLLLQTAPDAQARLGSEGALARCKDSPEVAGLKAQHLHAAFGPWLVTAQRPMACIVGMRERRTLMLSVDGQQIRLGEQLFSFTRNVETEQVQITRGQPALTYKIEYAGGSRVLLRLGRKGEIAELAATGPGGVSYLCSDRAA